MLYSGGPGRSFDRSAHQDDAPANQNFQDPLLMGLQYGILVFKGSSGLRFRLG